MRQLQILTSNRSNARARKGVIHHVPTPKMSPFSVAIGLLHLPLGRGESLPYTARSHDKKQKNIIKNSSNRRKITNFAIITKTTIKEELSFI